VDYKIKIIAEHWKGSIYWINEKIEFS